MGGEKGRRPDQFEPFRKGEVLLINKLRKPLEPDKGGMTFVAVKKVGL